MAQSPDDPSAIVRQVRANQPQTPEEIHEQLNLVERLASAVSPQDDYQAAILEAVIEINNAVKQLSGGGGQPVEPIDKLPQNVVPLLQDANVRLEEMVQGVVDTTALPIGLQGTARTDIQNGSEGVATFDFSGGQYAATVRADETINQFDDIRIVPGGDNLARPLPANLSGGDIRQPKELVQVYDKDVNANSDILANGIRPRSAGSSFEVSISMDTTTTFSAAVEPDADSAQDYTTSFLQGGDLQSNSLFEFSMMADPDATYNFQAGAAANIRSLRINEVLVA